MLAERKGNGKDVGRLMRPTIQTSVAKGQMKTETISKNGASPKSRTSRINIKDYLYI
jgi:hypothetical protein